MFHVTKYFSSFDFQYVKINAYWEWLSFPMTFKTKHNHILSSQATQTQAAVGFGPQADLLTPALTHPMWPEQQ